MFDFSLTFHVWEMLAMLIIVGFYMGPVMAFFRWVRGLTRGGKKA